MQKKSTLASRSSTHKHHHGSRKGKKRSSRRRDSALRIQRCQESLKDLYTDSNIFRKSKSTSQIKLQDIKRGSVIGRGTFGQVRSFTSLLFTHETSITQASSGISVNSIDDNVDEEGNSQSFNDPMSDISSPQKYVLKEIRGSILNKGDVTAVEAAAIDLARESRFLHLLSHHENIISFHSTGGCEGSINFFILMEKIKKTLDDLIQGEWKFLQKKVCSIAVQKYLKEQVSFQQHGVDLSKTPKDLKREATNKLSLELHLALALFMNTSK